MEYDGEFRSVESALERSAYTINYAMDQLNQQLAYVEKLDFENTPPAVEDGHALAKAMASLASHVQTVGFTAKLFLDLSYRSADPLSDHAIAEEVRSALNGDGVFLYVDGQFDQAARFAASVHHLVDQDPIDFESTSSQYYPGSLFGFLFRSDPDTSRRLATRVRDALVGKTSAEMTREEVGAYKEFVDAANGVSNAVLITQQYAFAKTASGVYGFKLDVARKSMIDGEPELATSPESFVKRMLDLRQPGDLSIPASSTHHEDEQ